MTNNFRQILTKYNVKEQNDRYVDTYLGDLNVEDILNKSISEEAFIALCRELYVRGAYRRHETSMQPSERIEEIMSFASPQQIAMVCAELDSSQTYFAKYIKKFLQDKGMPSITKMEQIVSISRGMLSQIIRGKTKPTHAFCAQIALFFKMSEEEAEELFRNAGFVLFKDRFPDFILRSRLKNKKYGMKSFCHEVNQVAEQINLHKDGKLSVVLERGYGLKHKYNNACVDDCYVDGKLDYLGALKANPDVFR